MKNKDLRLLYMIANKEAITADIVEEWLLRSFAASFCTKETNDHCHSLIRALTNCLYELLLADDDEPEAPITLTGNAAEKFYCESSLNLYVENGYDRLYAEEAAVWPDVLPSDAHYTTDMLQKMAELEVGHDLLVGDYLRIMAQKRVAGQEKKSGCVG